MPQKTKKYFSDGMGIEDREIRLRTIRSQGIKTAEFGMQLMIGRNGKNGGLDHQQWVGPQGKWPWILC